MYSNFTRRKLCCLLAMVFATGLSSCKKKGETLVIGLLVPLDGPAADMGKSAAQGAQLAIEQANRAKHDTDPELVLMMEDTKGQAVSAVSGIHKLVDADSISIAIGPFTDVATMAVAPIAAKSKVIIISPGATAPEITHAGDYIFRNEMSDAEGGRKQGELAFHTLGYRRMAAFYQDNDRGKVLHAAFKAAFEQLGGKLVLEEPFAPWSKEFRPALAKLQAADPDGILLIAGEECVPFLKQRKELGIDVPVFATSGFENASYLEQLGDAAEGVFYGYYGIFDPQSDNPVSKQFVTDYQERFGERPSYYSALAYDAAGMVVMALQMASFDESKTREALFDIAGFQGMTGVTSFDRNGDVSKPVSLKKVHKGEYVFVRPK